MSETRTAGSDGSNTVFATLSGMVGAGNAAGCWYLWKPAVGVTYDSFYQDSRVSIRAESETTYSLSTDGGKTISLRQFNPRWQSGRYYDAAGNAIASAGAANVTGLPVQVFFDPGVRAAQTTNNPNTNTNTGTDNTTTADQWTRGTDGSTDVWVAESGMAGKAVPGPWVWVAYKPTAGITYQSHYGGKTVSVQALGNGVYLLDVNGVQSRRVYDARWSGADFYTSTGAPAGSAAAAIASSGKDLSPAFFTPGPLAPNVTPPITPPVTPPITPPVTPPITPPISTFPTGPGTGPYVPIPKTDQVVPIPGETPKSAGGVGKIALAALAAWAMFNS